MYPVRMGWFSKLFGKKAVVASNLPPHIAAALVEPPRLVNEGHEFPLEPVVLGRPVTAAEIDGALAAAGFARGEGARWTRADVAVDVRNENDVTLLAFSGSSIVEAQRELLGALAWVNPLDGFYNAMRSPSTPLVELRHLIRAQRHYKCVGGVPAELQRHADADIQETVRLIDRDQMAAAARAQRSRKKA